MRPILAAGLAAFSLLSVAGAAPAQVQEPEPTPEECRSLSEGTQDSQGTQDGDAAIAGDPNLSERLERCKGILTPPPTGDGAIVEPAPGVGRTPVIEPEDIEPQPPG